MAKKKRHKPPTLKLLPNDDSVHNQFPKVVESTPPIELPSDFPSVDVRIPEEISTATAVETVDVAQRLTDTEAALTESRIALDELRRDMQAMYVTNSSLVVANEELRAQISVQQQAFTELQHNYNVRSIEMADASQQLVDLQTKLHALDLKHHLLEEDHNKLLSDFRAVPQRHVFQIIPKNQPNRSAVARIYVLANDVTDAVIRAVGAGKIRAQDVANVTTTGQQIII